MGDSTQNILICGIGGQGVVLAGKIISHAAFESGMDIKTSEVHGMSQRGGVGFNAYKIRGKNIFPANTGKRRHGDSFFRHL